jgi:predicted ATPase
MKSNQISHISIQGFKSIRECDLKLKDLNVLIGPNGAGKSNFVSFFRLVQQMLDGNMQLYVGKHGGPDAMLHFGRKKTEYLAAQISFGTNIYSFKLTPTVDNRFLFAKESFAFDQVVNADYSGHFESMANEKATIQKDHLLPGMQSWRVYHFHDTSDTALVKQRHGINVNDFLRSDARNLAAFLYLLKNQFSDHYQRIVKTIRLVAPFFGDFYLRPQPDNKEQIELEWIEKGEDIPFKAHLLSDGTLRFICLATVLLQPDEFQPETMLIDEPELGLHPFAVHLLASMLRSASKKRQVVISIQSPDLLNEFEVEDIVVADRQEGWTQLSRLDADSLATWLDEYSLGELWKKNILGGRPSR